MGLELEYLSGQTPLDEDEKEGIKIPSIATRAELDEFEQQNIEEAIQWLLGKSFKASIILSEKFVCDLHKKMFGEVWSWAGKFRKTDKNLGIDKWQIPTELKTLCDDTLFWIENETFSPDEISIRFKHRIVSIHCFPNGNGRHSRLMADLIVNKIYDKPFFSWGAENINHSTNTRKGYLISVREADKGNYKALLEFARSL